MIIVKKDDIWNVIKFIKDISENHHEKNSKEIYKRNIQDSKNNLKFEKKFKKITKRI